MQNDLLIVVIFTFNLILNTFVFISLCSYTFWTKVLRFTYLVLRTVAIKSSTQSHSLFVT